LLTFLDFSSFVNLFQLPFKGEMLNMTALPQL